MNNARDGSIGLRLIVLISVCKRSNDAIGKHHGVCETGVEPPPAGCHHAPLPPGPMPVR
jgi:hypothetical protein